MKRKAMYRSVTKMCPGISPYPQPLPFAYSIALVELLYKITVHVLKEETMIRIVCPHCHTPLSTNDLEQVMIAGHRSLICPDCSSVLVSESDESTEYHTLEEHFAEQPAHA